MKVNLHTFPSNWLKEIL